MSDNIELQWLETEMPLKDLKDYDRNPRKISKEAFQRLVHLVRRYGYHQRISVNLDNIIIGGHARKKVFKALGYKPNDLIKVLKPSRELTQEEFDVLNVSDNGAFGEFDMDGLANMGYDIETLKDWGAPEFLFNGIIEEDDEETIDGLKDKLNPIFKLEIEFLTEKERDKSAKIIEDLGFKVRIF